MTLSPVRLSFTYHVTAGLLALCTVAAKLCVPPAPKLTEVRVEETLTEATGGLTTTEAEAVLLVSDWDRAVTDTVICAATVAGAR